MVRLVKGMINHYGEIVLENRGVYDPSQDEITSSAPKWKVREEVYDPDVEISPIDLHSAHELTEEELGF